MTTRLIRIEGNIKQNPQESMQRSSNEVEFFSNIYKRIAPSKVQ